MTLQTLIRESEVDDSLESESFDNDTFDMTGGVVRELNLAMPPESTNTHVRNVEGEEGTGLVARLRVPSPLIRLPSGTLPIEKVEILQQWEGVVTDVCKDSFNVDLYDLAQNHKTAVAELSILEVPESDRQLVGIGSIFYWSIAYETTSGGQLKRMSEIRFQRLPSWTKKMLDRAKLVGGELFERFCQ
jgi:hypothetical protein